MNNTEIMQAQKALQNARAALRSGDRSAARHWAEQAARLAPQLEDPWLILASVASPRASMQYIERALQINPDSPRARKGMQWAMKRLQQAPPASGGEVPPAKKVPVERKPTKRSKRSAAPKKAGRRAAFPILLLVLGCLIVAAAAWTASTTPVLASILNAESQPTDSVARPQVWAQVEIAKPIRTSEPTQVVAAAQPTLPPPTATLPPPTSEPTLEPTAAPTLAPPTATLKPDPTAIPETTSTLAGSLVMEIVEDTPVPTAQPTDQAPALAQPPSVGNGERWIEVNLTEQRVYAWEGDVLMNQFIVSTGTWQTPTVTGTFKIWHTTRIQDMSGPGYYLPDVPWVMYFYEGYGFHGTYWHNNFGTPMSHGCVNMTIPDAEWLYNFAGLGTTVKVHY